MRFNPCLDTIKNYQAGRNIEEVMEKYQIKDVIKLASNENPYGCSPLVLEVLKNNAFKASLYPDDLMRELKQALAKKNNLQEKNFIIGAGSDQIIDFCIRAKCSANSSILMAKTTFAMYEIYAKQVGAKILKTLSDAHVLDEFREIYHRNKPDIIFLCLPNNPLGECLDFSDVSDFLKEIDQQTLVVIDGAYQEYARYKDLNKAVHPEIIKTFGNVIILQTFSKAYGLGGMRVGYGIADSRIIEQLHKVRPPFNVGTLSLDCAVMALHDFCFVEESIKNNFIQMQRYIDFAETNQICYIPSWTNFITFFCKGMKLNSTQIVEKLLQKGLIIRDLASYGLNAVRITIGTKEQNTKVFSLLKAFLS